VQFELGDENALDALTQALADADGGAAARREDGSLRVRDPDGQLLEFAAQP